MKKLLECMESSSINIYIFMNGPIVHKFCEGSKRKE